MPIGPSSKVIVLPVVGVVTMLAVAPEAETVKLDKARARFTSEPERVIVILAFLLPQVLSVPQRTVTSARAVPLLTRAPLPLILVTLPLGDAS